MQNEKTTVLTALQTASAITTIVSARIYFLYPPDFAILPSISYFELSNIGNLYADNQEIGSEIIYQIDSWSKASLSALALAIDDVMTGIDFTRIQSIDLFENDSRIHHKSMRYKINKSDPDF